MKNMTVGIICQIINTLLGFVVRSVFIHFLSIEYLGVNGLFFNILQFLSLVELGIGSAIIYRLYKPLHDNDTESLKAWMALYKKAYSIIGIIILSIGLAITPFIKYMINEEPDIPENLQFIFILFVLNSAISYFYIYKQSIIIADQKNYVVTITRQVFKLLQTIAQILILVLFSDFIAYLVIGIIFTFLTNCYISHQANKRYPFLKEEVSTQVSHKQKQSLFADVKALILNKIGYIVLNASNNIIISAFLSITLVGLCSNYFLILAAVELLIIQFANSFTASIGNFNVSKSDEHKFHIFKLLNFIIIFVCGTIYSAIVVFANDFITIWIGSQFQLNILCICSITSMMLFKNIGIIPYIFRSTEGLFIKVKYTSLVIAIIHVIFASILVNFCGISGVFLSASAAMISLNIYDIIIVAKKDNFSIIKSILFWIKLIGLTIIVCISTNYITQLLIPSFENAILSFVVRCAIFCIFYISIWIAGSLILIRESAVFYTELLTKLKTNLKRSK